MVAPAWPPSSPSGELEELALPTKYELDPFQKHAVLGIHAGDHVFVTAKTGSGKTFVGEYLIAYCLARGQRVFYTTPIKSLSNQKYYDLKKLFPNASVGILTGDIKMCPDAQIIVLTAEILRNLFVKRGTATEGVGLTAAVSLEGVGGIVMDEVHYIQDPDRGHVWEETLILAKTMVVKASVAVDTSAIAPVVTAPLQLVLLSATLPSAESLAGWLATLHQHRTVLLSTTYRIVPLVHGILTPDMEVVPLLRADGTWINDAYAGWLRERKSVSDAALAYKKAVDARARDGYAGAAPRGKVHVEDPVSRFHRMVAWLWESKQLPALFFIFSRRECERYAALVQGSLLDSSDAAAATHIIDFHLSRFRSTLEKSPQYHAIRGLLIRGIAFHHSGLQPLLKEIVEILFSRGFVRALFATETFSVGLNMPTKTVVFLELEKFSDEGKRLLRPDEYIQMAGRAGRRGLDTQGLVLYEPMRTPVDLGDLRGVITGALPPLQSRMRFHYDFILKNRLTTGIDIVSQSYWAQQQRDLRASVGQDLERLKARIATLGALITPEEEQALAEKAAIEAEIATSVNAKKKKAVAALNRWALANDEKRLASAMDTYKELAVVRGESATVAAQIVRWDAAPLLSVEPLEACLRELQMLDDDGALTTLGLCATESAESHLILMPLLAASGLCADLTANEVACVLAFFLQEGGDERTVDETGVSAAAKDVLYWLEDQADACLEIEDGHRVHSPVGFWRLNPLWVSVVDASLSGASLSTIAASHDLFEGNIQRALLRVANILEEWSAIATIRGDLSMLEKMRGLRLLDETTDSLYLRL
jgi:superfamily II RNA helicase